MTNPLTALTSGVESEPYGSTIAHPISRCALSRDGSGQPSSAIFKHDQDRQMFLRTLGEACEKTGWRVHAYVLMSNHYHLLLDTPEANLVSGMKWLQGTYTQRYNLKYKASICAQEVGYAKVLGRAPD